MTVDPAVTVHPAGYPLGAFGETSRVPFGRTACPFGTRACRPSGADAPNERPEMLEARRPACTLHRDEQPVALSGSGREQLEKALVS